MTNDEATRVLDSALHEVAPEADLSRIDPDGLLQDEIDIDSLDFLNLVTLIHERAGIDIPERDYPRLSTFGSIVAYLAAAAPTV
jgi:acyl carrier protein